MFWVGISYIIKMLVGLIKKNSESEQLKRSQSLFSSEISEINGFQTIVVKDWVHALGTPLDVLKRESGLSIIHSYFSFLGKHHKHRLFIDESGAISMEVNEVFDSLGKEIEAGDIWNPSMSEFMEYLNQFHKTDLRKMREFENYRYVV